MANVLVEESSLQDIADAIREKTGGNETYKPGQMASAIEGLSSGSGDGYTWAVATATRVDSTTLSFNVQGLPVEWYLSVRRNDS